MQRVQSAETRRDWYDKGLFDYQYVLSKCMNDTAAPYVAIFEDDIIFADGWLSRTLNALAELKQRARNKVAARKWIYLRLFYTESSLRWREADFWYKHMHFAFLGLMASGMLILVMVRRLWSKGEHYLTPFTIAIIYLATIPSFTALFYMAGKYTIAPLRGLELMNGYGCCTQGMIFPRDEIPSLLQYFRERVTGQTDTLIEEYSEWDGLDRYALAPQMLQHVGRVSSRDNDATTTKSTWAFWFENNKLWKLAREHPRAYDKLNWVNLRGNHH